MRSKSLNQNMDRNEIVTCKIIFCYCWGLESNIKWYCTFLLREKCPYWEFFWSVFSRIQTEYGKILSISPNSVRMRENTDQKNSEYGHFSSSVPLEKFNANKVWNITICLISKYITNLVGKYIINIITICFPYFSFLDSIQGFARMKIFH